jgi:hypothetical protein
LIGTSLFLHRYHDTPHNDVLRKEEDEERRDGQDVELSGRVRVLVDVELADDDLADLLARTSSSTGSIIRHGPHQGAQKSSRTGLSLFRTEVSKLVSVSSTTCSDISISFLGARARTRHDGRVRGVGRSILRRGRPRFGQHFLVNERTVGKILDALDVEEGDTVVEVGPGRGALTKPLLDRGVRVLAFEIDEDLADDLEEQLSLLLRVQETMTEARTTAATISGAIERLAGAGRPESEVTALKDLRARLVTASGAYPQPMLIDQLASIARMAGSADQKVGRSAFEYLEELRRELTRIKSELTLVSRNGRSTSGA